MARRKIIVDTDPGVDDVLAILLALASPEVDVVALTITFGNTGAPLAYANALKVYAQIARELAHDPSAAERYVGLARPDGRKTILAKGAEEPIDGEVEFAAYFHGKDGLSNISETHPQFTPPDMKEGEEHDYLEISPKASSEVILDILREEPAGSVTIVALGPLSNLALAIQADAKTFGKVGEVVWMGGALDVPGNTSSTAEFNSFADPYAAQVVIDQVTAGAFPMVMCPLDITTPHTIPFSELIQDWSAPASSSRPNTPLREFTSAMLGRVRGVMKAFGLPDSMEMHDPLAIWYALTHGPGETLAEEKDGWKTVQRIFKVERVGEYTRGMCVVDRRGTGEESFLRTKSQLLNEGAAVEEETTSGIKGAPSVVVQTPGKKVLEELLLSRVFGNK